MVMNGVIMTLMIIDQLVCLLLTIMIYFVLRKLQLTKRQLSVLETAIRSKTKLEFELVSFQKDGKSYDIKTVAKGTEIFDIITSYNEQKRDTCTTYLIHIKTANQRSLGTLNPDVLIQQFSQGLSGDWLSLTLPK